MKRLALLLLVRVGALLFRCGLLRRPKMFALEVSQSLGEWPKFLSVSLLAVLICSALPGQAQEVTFRFGAALQPSTETPRPVGRLGLIMGSGNNRSLTQFNLSQTDAKTVTAVQTGIERTLFKRGRAEVFACGTAGIATNTEATSGLVNGCTGLIVNVWRQFSVVVSGEAQNSPVEGGIWEPKTSLSLQWKPE